MTRIWAIAVYVLGTFFLPQNQRGPDADLPRLPHASLLVGYSPSFLMVTNTHESLRLQPEELDSRDSTPIYPSISRDGKVVAYARLKASVPERIVAISTYSATTGKKTDYAEGEYAGAVAISPDASRLAFSASRHRVGGSGDDHLHIVDLRTGQQTLGPEIRPFESVFASWSPDSRHLAYGFGGEIRVWDTDTGKISKIVHGDAPAWSPSGEWIAYLQGIRDPAASAIVGRDVFQQYRWLPRCLIVHPGGSGGKTLIELPHKRNFLRFLVEAPVWSPDSQTILLNELADVDKWTMQIHLLDLKTRKLKTISEDAAPVLGWASAN